MTNILQPLDRAINFPFKKYLKAKFTKFMLNEDIKKEILDEARIRIISDIVDVWNGYKDITIKNEYIPKVLVIKCFKITGISNLMDGSEDDKFDGFDLINELSDLKNDEVSSIVSSEKNEMHKIDEEGGKFEIEEFDD